MNPIQNYIKDFPEETQNKLNEIYQIIKEVVPSETTEKIAWRMPTFYLNGNLVHFASFKNHIGFYPGAKAIENFCKEFVDLKFSKGAVQFDLKKELPKKLIQDIVKYRVQENLR